MGELWAIHKQHLLSDDPIRLDVATQWLAQYHTIHAEWPQSIVLESLADFLLHNHMGKRGDGEYPIMPQLTLKRRKAREMEYKEEIAIPT